MSDSDSSSVATCEDLPEDFEDRFTELKLQWKNALKKTKKLLLKCPNYKKCQFKCGSVGGMQYHYLRCTGKSPSFKCPQCSRKYESRTGLNYHQTSIHGTPPMEEAKVDPPSRPQRTAALSTMSAILIANNPPPLKQALPRATPSKRSKAVRKEQQKAQAEQKRAQEEQQKAETEMKMQTDREKTPEREPKEQEADLEETKEVVEPKVEVKQEFPPTAKAAARSAGEGRVKGTRRTHHKVVVKEEEEETGEEGEGGSSSEGGGGGGEGGGKEESSVRGGGGGGGRGRGRGRGRGKRGSCNQSNKLVNIPSIEYPDEYKSFLPLWRQEMKDNKIIRCPNFRECEFKCTTVNGMKYHYVRCMKTNPPEFNCEVCGKKFQCRTGLVWHLKKTHNLVDIQPSKEGSGFHGTLSPELSMLESHLMEDGVRKKMRLEGWRGRGYGLGRRGGGVGGRRDWRRCYRRLRKPVIPRRTVDAILQNIMNIEALPEPKLGPESCRSNVLASEYVIADSIPTDVDPPPSAIITLSEEALQWQKMDSETESEEEYAIDSMDSSGVVTSMDMSHLDGFLSNSSVSDSDEEYTVPYYRRRGTGRGGRGSGGGRRGRGRGSAGADVKLEPKTVKSSGDVGVTSPVAAAYQPTPPPLLSKSEGTSPQVLIRKKVEPPSLIKDVATVTAKVSPIARGGGMKPSNSTHIQPPPGLIMPSAGRGSGGKVALKRLPPPLVKKVMDETGHVPIQPKVYHPQIVMPSSDATDSIPPSTHLNSSPAKAGVKHPAIKPAASYIASGASQESPLPPAAPVKRRPGRPRKDQSLNVNAQTKKTARTVHLGLNKPHQKSQSARSGRGQGGAGLMKGIKMTQYEFQSQQKSNSVGVQQQSQVIQPSQQSVGVVQANQGVGVVQSPQGMGVVQASQGMGVVQSPQGVGVVQAQDSSQQQYQPLILSSPGASSLPVTPLQILPTAAAASAPSSSHVSYSSVPQGGVIYLQGTTPSPSQEQPTYVTKDGQLYLIQPARTTLESPNDASKISVIMQPQAGAATTYMPAGEVGGFHYVTQLDGFPPSTSTDSGRSSAELRNRFEKVRRAAANIQQLDGLVPGGGGEKKPGQDRDTTSRRSKEKAGCVTCDELAACRGSSLVEPLSADGDHVGRHMIAGGVAGNSNNNCNEDGEGAPQDTVEVSVHSTARKRCRKGQTESPPAAKRSAPSTSTKKGKKAVATKSSVDDSRATSTTAKKGKKGKSLEVPSSSREKADIAETSESLTSSETPASSQPSPSTSSRRQRKVESSGKEVLHCPECENVYTTKSGLRIHMATKHHPDLAQDARIEECLKVWRGRLKMQGVVVCHICKTYRAKSVSGMKYHWSKCGKAEGEAVEFTCPVCDKTYSTKGGLKYHITAAHKSESTESTPQPSESDPIVPLPPRRAATLATSKMKEINTKAKAEEAGPKKAAKKTELAPYRAELRETGEVHCPRQGCDYSFKSIGGLKYHLQNHPGDRPVVVSTTSVEEKRYKCPCCSKVVPGKAALERHCSSKHPILKLLNMKVYETQEKLDSEEEEEEEKEEEVEGMEEGDRGEVEWAKEVEKKRDMTLFKQTLEKEGIVDCPNEDCKKTFRSLAGLRYHLDRAHLEQKRTKYKCPCCGKVLTSKKSFKWHCNRKHPEETLRLLRFEEYECLSSESEQSSSEEDDDEEEEGEGGLEEEGEVREKGRRERTKARKQREPACLVEGLPRTHESYLKALRDYHSVWSDTEAAHQPVREIWIPHPEHWTTVQDSERSDYLPASANSMQYRLSADTSSSSSLSLFQSCSTSDDGEAIFFAGGPVWAMDWGPQAPPHSQWLALTAKRHLDETHSLTCSAPSKGSVQLWDLGNLTNDPPMSDDHSPSPPPPLPTPKLGVVVAHDYGQIGALKWCKFGSHTHLLGVLSLACGDGCIRILSIPSPSLLPSSPTTNVSPGPSHSDVPVVQPLQVAATLVPVGTGVEEWAEFGRCLCMDWFPGNKRSKVVAGFSNGSVCIWDLDMGDLFRSSSFASSTMTFHPVVHLVTSEYPCQCVCWCAHDDNYIFTGGLDKMACLWDVRQPFSPIDKMEKGCMTRCVWPTLWCGVLSAHSSDCQKSNSKTVQYNNYMSVPAYWNHTTSEQATSDVSYCSWTDRAIVCTYGGELGLVSFPTAFHVTLWRPRSFVKKHYKVVFSCHLEDVSGSDSSKVMDTDYTSHEHVQSMEELADRSRLVMTSYPKVKDESQFSIEPDEVPLAAFTQVCWSPNEWSCKWLVVGTNSGLVQLLYLPTYKNKPF